VLSFSHPKYALLDVPKFGHIYQILGTKKHPPIIGGLEMKHVLVKTNTTIS